MEYRYLGATGLKVSELCLGAMTFGRETSEDDSHRMLDRFVDAGGNFIDTANVYGAGASEDILGRWLAGRTRDECVIATKVRFPMGKGPNEVGLSRKHILASVEASLRRLRIDYIDLYQVHSWDGMTPLRETLSTLHTLVQSGKVRYLGASNFSGWQLQKAVDTSLHITCLPERGAGRHSLESLARRVAQRKVPARHGGATRGQQGGRCRAARLGRALEYLQQRAHVVRAGCALCGGRGGR